MILRIVFLLLLVPAMCAGAMRCQDGCDLLQVGDSKLKVMECMGEPDYVDKALKRSMYGKQKVEIETGIETWFYRIDGWVYSIKIMNGRVAMINDLGRE